MITTELGKDIGYLIVVLQDLPERQARVIVTSVMGALSAETEEERRSHRNIVNAGLRGDAELANAECKRHIESFVDDPE